MKNRKKYNHEIVIQKRCRIKTSELTMDLVPVSRKHQSELDKNAVLKGLYTWYALPSKIIRKHGEVQVFDNVINERDIPDFFPNHEFIDYQIAECRL